MKTIGTVQTLKSVVAQKVNKITRQRLLNKLGYQFDDETLLDLALSHRSIGAINNERLEFLGDSILNFIIGEALFLQFPAAKEGQLSSLRSTMVKGETLASIAREFDLGDSLTLGEGEMKSGGFRRDSILADAVEAIIGAIYQDSNFETVRELVLSWYSSRLSKVSLTSSGKDAKSTLQELMQSRKQPLPDYQVIEVSGDAHAQQYTVECSVTLTKDTVSATATSRKSAEKKAAQLMLEALGDV